MARGSFMTGNKASSSGGGAPPVVDSTIVNVTSLDTTADIQTQIDGGNIVLTFESGQTYDNFSDISITGDNVVMNLNGAIVQCADETKPLIKSGGGKEFRIHGGTLRGQKDALINQSHVATATGIHWDSNESLKVNDLRFEGFRDAGMRVTSTSYAGYDRRLYHISDCEFYGCFIGFVNERYAQYGVLSDCMINACGIGIINTSGNWQFSDLTVNYGGNGIVTIDEDTNYSTHSADAVRGAIVNGQIHHVSSSSKWSTAPTLTVGGPGGIGYQGFGYLAIGDKDSPVNGLSMYHADIKVLGNRDNAYQMSDVIAEECEIDGGSDKGITLTGFTRRTAVTKVGKVFETVKSSRDSVQHFPPKEQYLYNSNLDASLSVGDRAVGPAVTDYSDFYGLLPTKMTLVRLDANNRVLRMNDNSSGVPTIRNTITPDDQINLSSFGGFVEFEFLKEAGREFGGFVINPPLSTFNLYIKVNKTTIEVLHGPSLTKTITGVDTEVGDYKKLRVDLEASGNFRVSYDGVEKVGQTAFGLFANRWKTDATYANSVGYTSGSGSGRNIGGRLKEINMVIYKSRSTIVIPPDDYDINYYLIIPPTETRAITMQVPDHKYPEGVQIAVQNRSAVPATVLRENANVLIKGGSSVSVSAGATAFLTANYKGFEWS